jgi:quercetin dioxygenase-like cupin family protein
MILRNYLHGQTLKVGDLNEITVLVDRGETSLTEVATNSWRKGLNGPPHSHVGKEQVFFVTEGNGVVNVQNQSHKVRPGSLVYIPEGVVHQSVADESGLTYFLFNAFLDPAKEGCATYAEHIEQVKEIRERQAATGKATEDPNLGQRVSAKRPRAVPDARGVSSAMLLARADSGNCEVERVGLRKNESRTAQHADREQTLFVLSGSGAVTVSGETGELKPGEVIFIPMNAPQSVRAGGDGLAYLSLSTFALPQAG